MNTTTKNIYSLPILVFIIGLLVSIFLLYNHLGGWYYYNNFGNNASPFVWLWIRMSIWTIIIYNLFRIYDYTYSTSITVQKQHKNVFRKILLGLFIVSLPAILLNLWAGGNQYWMEQGYDQATSASRIVKIGKTIIGKTVETLFEFYKFIREIVKESLIEIGFLGEAIFTYENQPITARDIPYFYDVITTIVIFMLIMYRKVILRIYNILYSLFNYLIRFFIGDNQKAMSKGVLGIISKKGAWLKGLIFFILGIDTKQDTSRGSAAFAQKSEQKEFIKKKENGLLIDGERSLTWDLSMRHVAVLAPSGQHQTMLSLIFFHYRLSLIQKLAHLRLQ